MKFSFTIIIFVCWTTLLTANDIQISLEFPNYANEFEHQCKESNDIALNFPNTVITSIGQNFISSPLITCLNLTNTGTQSIQNGAFKQLPNLSHLFISNNLMKVDELFSFGGHENLKMLILNNATTFFHNYNYHRLIVNIFEEYPRLEILSLRRNNYINDLQTSIEKIPFPKLKILDLSNNDIRYNNFLKLLSNSLYFLDLHNNSFNSLAFDKKQVNLLALNLDNNNLKYVMYNSRDLYNLYNMHNQYNQLYRFERYYDQRSYQYDLHDYGLTMAGLETLHYLSISGNKIDFILSNAFKY